MDDYAIEKKNRVVFERPNYTQTPNILFDELMKDMSEVELKVTLCIIRKIVGYHKTKPEAVSLSQIQEMTGLSRQASITGLERAIERGIICKAGTGKRGVNLYQLVHNLDQSTNETSTSQDFRPELVYKIDTQNKELKENRKEKISPAKQEQANAGLTSKLSSEEYEELLSAIERVLLVKGSRKMQYYHLLQGTSKNEKWASSIEYFLELPMKAPELLAFGLWYLKTCPNASVPTKAEVLEDWVRRFRDKPTSEAPKTLQQRKLPANYAMLEKGNDHD